MTDSPIYDALVLASLLCDGKLADWDPTDTPTPVEHGDNHWPIGPVEP